jgi:predicted dehydrogenase
MVARIVQRSVQLATVSRVATLRIGVLGAARITPSALIKPAAAVPEVEVAGVAARDPARAAAFATKHGLAKSFSSYAELLADDSIPAVYLPLPNGLHAEWTLRAIDAGKHVLCEKPMTANAAEAAEVARAAVAAGVVVTEAFHYRYHPLMARVLQLVRQLGELRHVEARMCFPLPGSKDIRYDYALGGGAMMDAGCYAVHAIRTMAGQEPEVVAARAKLKAPQVDRLMVTDYAFPRGATGRTTASLWSRTVLGLSAKVVGERGALRIFNFVAPQFYHRLSIDLDGRTSHERVPGETSYIHQLRGFASAVAGGENLTPASDAVNTMRLIDESYRKAGLKPRG